MVRAPGDRVGLEEDGEVSTKRSTHTPGSFRIAGDWESLIFVEMLEWSRVADQLVTCWSRLVFSVNVKRRVQRTGGEQKETKMKTELSNFEKEKKGRNCERA